MASFHELFDSLDPDPNVRGRQFERIVKWWLLHDPFYKGQIEQVWLWDEWPGRWGADACTYVPLDGPHIMPVKWTRHTVNQP